MSQIRREMIHARLMAEHQRRWQQSPPCPACCARMELTRVIPRDINYFWEQVVFQCHRCEVALTQAGEGGTGSSVAEPVGLG
jgi:hypothetical protein